MDRAMKVQDVMLQAMAKKITWWQAAENSGSATGICGDGGSATSKRAKRVAGPAAGQAVAPPGSASHGGEVFALYREKYFDLNVQHFHEKLQASTESN